MSDKDYVIIAAVIFFGCFTLYCGLLLTVGKRFDDKGTGDGSALGWFAFVLGICTLISYITAMSFITASLHTSNARICREEVAIYLQLSPEKYDSNLLDTFLGNVC